MTTKPRDPSPRQAEALIVYYLRRKAKRSPPTMRELCVALSLASLNSAAEKVEALIEKGCLHRVEAWKTRAIALTPRGSRWVTVALKESAELRDFAEQAKWRLYYAEQPKFETARWAKAREAGAGANAPLEPATPKQLAELRAWTQRRPEEVPRRYTCDGCKQAPTCPWVFDSYNTDGDCLAEK